MEKMQKATVSYAPLIVLVLAQFGISSDTTTVALAANSVVGQLGGNMADIQMVNMMFGLVAGIFMITGGMTGLIIGWGNNFRLGALFAFAGELVMALAPSTFVFVWVGRVLVGLGASFLIPSVLGIVPAIYQGKRRVFAYGCVTAGTGAAALTPIPLGILIDSMGFRTTFGVVAAFFLALLALSIRLPKVERQAQRPQFDKAGFAACSIGFFFLLTGISCASTCGLLASLPDAPVSIFGIAPTVPMICLGLVSLVVFSRIEKRRESQGLWLLMPRSFLGSSAARNALLAVAFGFFLAGAFNILVIPYIQMAANASALTAGLLFACAGVPMMLFAIGTPKAVPEVAPRTIVRLGYCIGAVGCFIIAFGLGQSFVVECTAVGMFVAGTGIGLVNSYASHSVACAVGEKDVQQSGGIQGTVRDIAHALAAALLGTMLAFVLSVSYSTTLQSAEGLSVETRNALLDAPVAFSSDAAFGAVLDASEVAEGEKGLVLESYRSARCEANQISLVLLGVGILAMIPFTRRLPAGPKR